MPLSHQQVMCFSRYNFVNILCSLTNCISVLTLPASSPALLPASSSIAVLMTVVVSTSVSAPIFLLSLFSLSSSSSSSSCELSVMKSQSDFPLSLSQPSSSPSSPAFSTTCLALQASHRMQRREKYKQN